MPHQNSIYIGVLIITLFILYVLYTFNLKEDMSGFGVISSLNFYNKRRYCEPGNEFGYSGGCFSPNTVII